MQVVIGEEITSQLIDPAGDFPRMGARVEEPITEAIVSPWAEATLQGSVWTATCDPILASTGPGDYLLYWMTPDDPPSFRAPLPLTAVLEPPPGPGTVPDFPPVDPEQVTPTLQQVSDLERTRTVEEGMNVVTIFDSDTSPSDADVGRLIAQAVPAVLGSLRYAFPTRYYEDVQHIIALYTSVLIEGSFYKEQTAASGMSVMRATYTQQLTAIQGQIEYDLKQWRLMQRVEPPFQERREPWQRVGWNPGAIP